MCLKVKWVCFWVFTVLSFGANAGVIKYSGLSVKSVRTLGGENGSSKFLITTDQPVQVPNGLICTNHFYTFDEADNAEMALSVALTALMSGKKIYMYVYDDKCSYVGRVAVRDIGIEE